MASPIESHFDFMMMHGAKPFMRQAATSKKEIEFFFIRIYSFYISPMTIFFLISISKLASVLSWNLFNGGLKLINDCLMTAWQLPDDCLVTI